MAAVVAFDGPAAAAGAAAAAGGAAACTAAAGAGAAGGAGLGAVAGSAADSVSPAAAPIACADASCWRANSSLAAVFAALRCSLLPDFHSRLRLRPCRRNLVVEGRALLDKPVPAA